MANIALLTAAGSGTRVHQDIPKQFLHVNNKPIIIYTLEAFQRHPNIDEICVVILKGWEEILKAYARQFNYYKLKICSRRWKIWAGIHLQWTYGNPRSTYRG